MTNFFFQFGESIPDHQVRVLNERAVRAAAGILFFAAMVAFMNAMLLGNFQPTRVFVMYFLMDFIIRIFINPRFAPSLIVGQWVVRKQAPEYVGAAQKRFAWSIGLVLALLMSYLIVLKGIIGPINMMVCSSCLLLMFFESAFGICIGCMIYNTINKKQAQLCPGDVCTYQPPANAGGTWHQGIAVVLAIGVICGLTYWVDGNPISRSALHQPDITSEQDARCLVPEFAKKIGHEAQWKLHNGC
jgi:hypothetical protein